MFVFVSHLSVPAADHAALESHFRDRSHLVEGVPGFLAQRFPPDEAAAARIALDAGLAALGGAAAYPP